MSSPASDVDVKAMRASAERLDGTTGGRTSRDDAGPVAPVVELGLEIAVVDGTLVVGKNSVVGGLIVRSPLGSAPDAKTPSATSTAAVARTPLAPKMARRRRRIE
jgi:hypothetical protein